MPAAYAALMPAAYALSLLHLKFYSKWAGWEGEEGVEERKSNQGHYNLLILTGEGEELQIDFPFGLLDFPHLLCGFPGIFLGEASPTAVSPTGLALRTSQEQGRGGGRF